MSIRIWVKTDEPVRIHRSMRSLTHQLFLEEERERELEKLYDAAPVSGQSDKLVPGRAPGERDDDGDEVTAVSKTTNETLSAGERLIEAIERADADAVLPEGQPRDPVLAQTGEDGPRHVLRVVASIPAPQLNDSLLVLPFGHSLSLLRYADMWLAEVRRQPGSLRLR